MSIAARRISRHPATTSSPPSTPSLYGPVSYPDLATAVATLHAPVGASYVTWNDTWPNDMEYVMANYLTDDDILVLPERKTPYYIESANGFTYPSNIASWSDGAKLVHNNRTWGEMTRVRRGIIGLGPQAVVALKPSSFTQVAQGDSTTRYYTTTDGTQTYENGCYEKLIGCTHSNAYFGNFTLAPSLDFGGVAYNAIGWTGSGGNVTFERIYAQGAHRGFSGGPNGETGALSATHGTYEIYNCEVDCRLPDGTSVGPSPIMINSSPGGQWHDSFVHHALQGMPTLWNSSGTHTITNVRSESHLNGPGWNLEKNQSGATFNFYGGDILHMTKKFQLNIGGYDQSAKVNCHGVAYDPSESYWPGYFAIQTYGAGMTNNQLDSDISILDADGNPVPTKIAH